jgi:cytochrome-b5 reductase
MLLCFILRQKQKEIISHDTRRFTFDLQTPQTRLGLPIGQHISLRFTDSNGKSHQRSYTPTTGDELLGKVTFVIKVYKAGVHPRFPDGGIMSQHLDSLKIGEEIEMRGPKGLWLFKEKTILCCVYYYLLWVFIFTKTLIFSIII